MKITHTVKLKREAQFEMEYFTAEIEAADLPEALRSWSDVKSQLRLMEYMVQREIISMQMQSGHMQLADAGARIAYLRECLGPLEEEVKKYGL